MTKPSYTNQGPTPGQYLAFVLFCAVAIYLILKFSKP